jgi:hypothetical protein
MCELTHRLGIRRVLTSLEIRDRFMRHSGSGGQGQLRATGRFTQGPQALPGALRIRTPPGHHSAKVDYRLGSGEIDAAQVPSAANALCRE